MTTEEVINSCQLPMIIVGNATLSKNYGQVIDLFPTIIRFNNYDLVGNERILGRNTTYRCTSGCADITKQSLVPEFSPFRKDSKESWNLESYGPLICAEIDIHMLTHLRKPSTGFAFLLLAEYLKLDLTIVGFDGFRSPNMGQSTIVSTHSKKEWVVINNMKNLTFLC